MRVCDYKISQGYLGYDIGVARTNRELAGLFSRQARLDEALAHAEAAAGYYERIGDRLNQEKVRNVLAVLYMQTGQYEKVVATAEASLPFFKAASTRWG